MATTAQQIADKAWTVLQDTIGGTGVRWPAAEVLGWINDGQREVVMFHPQAYTKATKAALVSGTRQTLADMGLTDGLQIIKLVRNWSADQTTPGRAISRTLQAVLDQELPDWHSATGPAVIHYVIDPAEPKACYVWPAVASGKRAEVVYSAVPPDIAAIGNATSLDDIYANALLNYVLFRALSKRTAGAGTAKQEAGGYYNLFLQALGIKDRITFGTDAQQGAREGQA